MRIESCKTANYLYDCRKNFSIVALTGLSGSGCSEFAKMISDREFYKEEKNDIRKPQDIMVEVPDAILNTDLQESSISHSAIKKLIFKREYTICYNYVTQHYEPYVIIKYNKVLWLYVFKKILFSYSSEEDGSLDLRNKVVELVNNFYGPSNDEDGAKYARDYKQKNYQRAVQIVMDYCRWKELYEEIKSLNFSSEERSNDDKIKYANVFFNKESELSRFYNFFNSKLSPIDYYCYCFFYHRLGFAIRSVDDVFIDIKEKFNEMLDANKSIFTIVKEINWLIKCLRAKNKKNSEDGIYGTRVCIDSLRNSLEAAFLRERFSAFYFIAVSDINRSERLKSKIRQRVYGGQYVDDNMSKYLENMQQESELLCKIEALSDQYTKGQFAGCDISQCVADAEIHIVQPDIENDNKEYSFYSLGEQWMKISALILHPGIITPSSEERCMEVAYTAKFNSGCISRQVGAVITNKNHAIRSIGWNDVPYGQIPCNLREIPDLVENTIENIQNISYRQLAYSSFETSVNGYPKYKQFYQNKSFQEGLRYLYEKDIDSMKRDLDALPLSYCFKDLHNGMLGDKNQVFTRSLHAEENAMMQMVKYGGESLMDGIIYVTASPCELCSKKLYQLGIRKIVYIDPYPGIAREHIISNGFRRPRLQLFKGVYGATYCKLYQPFIAYKDELAIRLKKYKIGDKLNKI